MNYSKEEIHYMLEDCYFFHEDLTKALMDAFSYLPRETVDRIINGVFFMVFSGSSLHFSKNIINGRNVVAFDEKDLAEENKRVITVLYEAAHYICGHDNTLLAPEEISGQRLKEAWDKVREWLPDEFGKDIEVAEKKAEAGKRSS